MTTGDITGSLWIYRSVSLGPPVCSECSWAVRWDQSKVSCNVRWPEQQLPPRWNLVRLHLGSQKNWIISKTKKHSLLTTHFLGFQEIQISKGCRTSFSIAFSVPKKPKIIKSTGLAFSAVKTSSIKTVALEKNSWGGVSDDSDNQTCKGKAKHRHNMLNVCPTQLILSNSSISSFGPLFLVIPPSRSQTKTSNCFWPWESNPLSTWAAWGWYFVSMISTCQVQTRCAYNWTVPLAP